MFLLFGTRASEALLVLVSFVCPHCGVEAAQRVSKLVTRFTLFFVPLFPVSTKYAVECQHCGRSTSLTAQQAAHSMEWAAAQS